MGGLHGLSCLVIRGSLESESLRVKGIVSGIRTDIVAAGQGQLEDNSQPRIPLNKSQSSSKPADKKDATADGKIVQGVVRIVRDGTLVHCYLACGHMLTMHSSEVVAVPSSLECWACKAEAKER
jgi:hypothetical protein